jgi:hypothetical protein
MPPRSWHFASTKSFEERMKVANAETDVGVRRESFIAPPLIAEMAAVRASVISSNPRPTNVFDECSAIMLNQLQCPR